MNSQVLRITPATFCDTVGLRSNILMTTPLSSGWPFPQFRCKGKPLPWIQQICDLQNDAANNRFSKVSCVTLHALESWDSMSAADIRALLPPKPGPILRFKAGLKRLQRSQAHLEQFQQKTIARRFFQISHSCTALEL